MEAPPLRVCWVIKGLGPGGAERLLVEAARAHDPLKVSLHVVYLLRQKSHLVTDLKEAGCTVELLDVTDGRDLRWLPRLVRALRRRRPDVVHFHSPLVAAPLRLLARGRVLGRNRPAVVATEHNAWSTYNRWTRLLNRMTVSLNDATVAVSEEVKASLSPDRERDRAIALQHGIDVAGVRGELRYRDEVREELGIGPAEVVVGTVANYRRQKNYPMLLRTARRLVDELPGIRFVAVGQGPLQAEIEALHVELGLGDRFLLLGYRPDATRVMACMDVFTLSSSWEGLPVALMEALALGLPIVGTAVGGVAETVTADIGLLAPPDQLGDYADAVHALCTDGPLRAQLARGAARAADAFDVSRSARRLEDIYATAWAAARRR